MLGAAAALLAALPASAGAYVYFINRDDNSIGRATLDGSHVQKSWILDIPHDASLAVNNTHIYWGGGRGKHAIWRALIPTVGNSPDRQKIVTGLQWYYPALALDSAHLYWTDLSSDLFNDDQWIGRSNLDGSGPAPHLITFDDSNPSAALPGLAVDAGYIYWSHYHWLGRASINGTIVESKWLPGVHAEGIAIDDNPAGGEHIYWTDQYSAHEHVIGRASLDGTHVKARFIEVKGFPWGLAIHGSHIYWTDLDKDWIGRATLDGQNVHQKFIVARRPGAIAVDSRRP
jgi:hypothetical protein